MMFRAIASRAVLVSGLLLSLNLSAAPACDGAGCANGKPLNILQFMREQAASTRTGQAKPTHIPSRETKGHAKAAVKHGGHRTLAAQAKPVPMPAEAAASFASRPEQPAQQSPSNSEVVASDETNAIDHAATTAPVQTTGAAFVPGPVVQLVDATEFNDIDRKADEGQPLSGTTARADDAPTRTERADNSWLQWIWSALGNVFTALATAVRQLTRI